jgi:D-beta-D-heptose 7-phosphate kinase/D-beta-D-heptose 1-phosphate adenosyltransferase
MRLVFANGCFDVLHVGHFRLLAWARERGDRLIVGLNSDASFESIRGRAPYHNQDERREMLEMLPPVDEVRIFDEDTPLELIRSLSPDVLVKGPDYAGRQVVGAELVSELAIPEWGKDHSSGGIAQAVRESIDWESVGDVVDEWVDDRDILVSPLGVRDLIDRIRKEITA